MSDFINSNTTNNLENEEYIVRLRCLELALTYRNFNDQHNNWSNVYISLENCTNIANVLEKYVLEGQPAPLKELEDYLQSKN